jgi:hypothetical protein
MIFYLIAEGSTEEFVAEKLLPFCGHELHYVYGKYGCNYIRRRAAKFQYLATKLSGVLVLTDFRDSGAACVPEALHEYIYKNLPNPPETFLCRFAVNEMESWLLADREKISKFLGISVSRIPERPEDEEFPKKTLVNLARISKIRMIRDGIVPPPGHQ